MDMNYRTTRVGQRTGDKHNFQSNYLNCAAPKSVLTHNCNMIRQIQRDYPPFPTDIGNYTKNQIGNNKLRPNTLEIPSKMLQFEMQQQQQQQQQQQFSTANNSKLKKHPGILKNYKSCPVSPVHEELEWCSIPLQGSNLQFNEPKRHSLYSDDAKTILDMIHTDTEKMIAEITSKYGDLDEYVATIPPSTSNSTSSSGINPITIINQDEGKEVPKYELINKQIKNNNSGLINKTIEQLKYTAQKEKNEHGFLSEEDGNFSSDSLEDCSLDLELNINNKFVTNKKRTVCKKHNKLERQKHQQLEQKQQQHQLPKRSVSDYYIFEDFTTNQCRKVSLSDILYDDETNFLETQRHSSASFFLGQHYPDYKSQESIISDDYSGGGVGGYGVSYCNSMESILSDESECKSAPLEILFGRSKNNLSSRYSINNIDNIKNDNNSSKSYGSSPNATIGFDYFMQTNKQFINKDYYDITKLRDYRNNHLLLDNNKSPTGFYHQQDIQKPLTNSFTYPHLSIVQQDISNKNDDEFIPSLTVKNAQYNCSMNKSLSKEFANQRHQNNTNPLLSCDGSELFVRKITSSTATTTTTTPTVSTPTILTPTILTPTHTITPITKTIITEQPSTSKSSSITRSDIFGDSILMPMKKSCSFEIQLSDDHRTPKSLKRFEQNLEKFNRERKSAEQQRPFGGTLEMDYVPHKPPVANRRSSSMRSKNKPKLKDKCNTIGQINLGKREIRDFVNKEFLFKKMDDDEKSFDLYVAEKGICEDDNMDSLEVFPRKNLLKENSIDSLDDIPLKYQDIQRTTTILDNYIDKNLITTIEYKKFRDIEKKIDVINKLVELEEKKLEHERVCKEKRMRPFSCDLSQKGYVKNLTKNFDKLAKTSQIQLDNDRPRNIITMKRNYSLPDVLEGAKMKTFEFTDDDLHFKDINSTADDTDRRHLGGSEFLKIAKKKNI